MDGGAQEEGLGAKALRSQSGSHVHACAPLPVDPELGATAGSRQALRNLLAYDGMHASFLSRLAAPRGHAGGAAIRAPWRPDASDR